MLWLLPFRYSILVVNHILIRKWIAYWIEQYSHWFAQTTADGALFIPCISNYTIDFYCICTYRFPRFSRLPVMPFIPATLQMTGWAPTKVITWHQTVSAVEGWYFDNYCFSAYWGFLSMPISANEELWVLYSGCEKQNGVALSKFELFGVDLSGRTHILKVKWI